MKSLFSLLSTKNISVIAGLIMLALPTCFAHAASADRDKIVEGAKKEGQLVLYTGMETEEANIYTKEFTKKYPLIKTEIFRAAGEKVQARFLIEHRAGTHMAARSTMNSAILGGSRVVLTARRISSNAPRRSTRLLRAR